MATNDENKIAVIVLIRDDDFSNEAIGVFTPDIFLKEK